MVQFLFGLMDPTTGIWHAFLVRHAPEGSELRPASTNSWALPPRQYGELRAGSAAVQGGIAETGDLPAVRETPARPLPEAAVLPSESGVLLIKAAN